MANVTTELENVKTLRNMWMLFITMLGVSPVDIVTTKPMTDLTWKDMSRILMTKSINSFVANVTSELDTNMNWSGTLNRYTTETLLMNAIFVNLLLRPKNF